MKQPTKPPNIDTMMIDNPSIKDENQTSCDEEEQGIQPTKKIDQQKKQPNIDTMIKNNPNINDDNQTWCDEYEDGLFPAK